METVRLRRIQEPSHVERLLEAYVSRSGLLPNDAFQIRAQRALSPQLQRVVARATPKGHVWACWADSYHTWLFTCEMSLPLSRERGAPVLLVDRSEEHTSELQSRVDLVCRLLLEKKNSNHQHAPVDLPGDSRD